MDLSIVIPVFNESKILSELIHRLKTTLEARQITFEVMLVDDGSTDGSRPLIEQYNQSDERIRALFLSRNFGHQTAITAGLHHAKGDAVAIMDGDLQDPPEILSTFWEKLQEGYDVVYGIRQKRKENLFKRLAYFLFYRLLNCVSEHKIPLDSGDFCMMRQKIVTQLNQMPEHDRFVRGLRAWVGYKQIGVEYERAERKSGESKFTLSKLVTLAVDAIVSFSAIPMRIIIQFGFVTASTAFAIGFSYVILKLLNIGTWPSGFATLILAISFLGGIQLITAGIIGEYIGRIHTESKNRPLYLISDYVGIPTLASTPPDPTMIPLSSYENLHAHLPSHDQQNRSPSKMMPQTTPFIPKIF